jgi:hypothetical protein
MHEQALRHYFETEVGQRRALGAVAHEGWLNPSGNLVLYEASKVAFDPLSARPLALWEFEKIYHELSGIDWQVFRSSNPNATHWDSRQTFNFISGEFKDFSWRAPVNLKNFRTIDTGQLESALKRMEGIKSNKDYPLMTVSKFLHFFNPALFPIYDTKVIRERVFSRFLPDFKEFCLNNAISYELANAGTTATFMLHYMNWASNLLAYAHENFMNVFVEWLDKQPGTDLSRRSFDVKTLYATAFEFIAIGAASVQDGTHPADPAECPAARRQ